MPQESRKDYLCNRYKQIVGNPKWAKIEKINEEIDDLDNEILKVLKSFYHFSD